MHKLCSSYKKMHFSKKSHFLDELLPPRINFVRVRKKAAANTLARSFLRPMYGVLVLICYADNELYHTIFFLI